MSPLPPFPIPHPWGLGGTLRRAAGHLRANHPTAGATARPFPRDAPRSVPNPHCQLRTSIESQTVPRRDHMFTPLSLTLDAMMDTGDTSEAGDASRREPTPYESPPPVRPLSLPPPSSGSAPATDCVVWCPRGRRRSRRRRSPPPSFPPPARVGHPLSGHSSLTPDSTSLSSYPRFPTTECAR